MSTPLPDFISSLLGIEGPLGDIVGRLEQILVLLLGHLVQRMEQRADHVPMITERLDHQGEGIGQVAGQAGSQLLPGLVFEPGVDVCDRSLVLENFRSHGRSPVVA